MKALTYFYSTTERKDKKRETIKFPIDGASENAKRYTLNISFSLGLQRFQLSFLSVTRGTL